jgi:nucleoside-diphosphate-sugar epimerase
MHLLVTGGTGFVMSHVIRQWVERGADYRVTSVDVFPADASLQAFLEPFAGQIKLIEGSVTEQSFWEHELVDLAPDYFIHGAAMTPNRNGSEKSQARTVVEVNIQGVLNAFEWARSCKSLQRMVHVSTGSIYGDDGPDGPLPEDGFEMRNPDSLYPITKRAGELLALRYREMFDLPLVVSRLSSIYGPMDRWTPGRDFQCVPNLIVQHALQGKPIFVAGAEGVGDWLHVADVASGMLALIDSQASEPAVFNISYGEIVSIRQLLEIVAAHVEDTDWQETLPEQADIVGNPDRRLGAWGAYDNSRLRALGWSPTPLHQALTSYVDWVRETMAASESR